MKKFSVEINSACICQMTTAVIEINECQEIAVYKMWEGSIDWRIYLRNTLIFP